MAIWSCLLREMDSAWLWDSMLVTETTLQWSDTEDKETGRKSQSK
jgi:hypothetical protein